MTRRPFEPDFEDELYPHQKARNTVAIIVMAIMHIVVGYMLWTRSLDHIQKEGVKEGQLVFMDLQAKKESPKPQPAKRQPPPKRISSPRAITVPKAKPVPEVQKTDSPVPAPVVDTMAEVAAARARRQAQENQAVAENRAAEAAQGPSENDLAMARIKANIQAANYNRKGTSGVFQILDIGVQVGRFSFRGWTNDPGESIRRTYEVDAGVGGDVRLAIIRRMIQLIREHYTGDFNWESQRLDRVIVLSARPQDNAQLEAFLTQEFYGNNQKY